MRCNKISQNVGTLKDVQIKQNNMPNNSSNAIAVAHKAELFNISCTSSFSILCLMNRLMFPRTNTAA